MWNSLITLIAPEQSEQDQLFSKLASGSCSMYDLDTFLNKHGAGNATRLQGNGGMSLLHAAALGGNVEVARRLVSDLGLSVHAKTINGGNTPAHLAASKGHERMVEYLAVECGASVGVKNSKGQNVFDIAEGLNLRQTLMKLVLQEEIRNGTAPVIAGATQDRTKDIERLKNLPPPPIYTSSSSAPTSSLPPSLPLRAHIQPDGFVTTVGNPELAAKYGNQVQARLHSTPSHQPLFTTTTAPPMAPPPASFQNNTTRSKYVVSTPGIMGYNVLASSSSSSSSGSSSHNPNLASFASPNNNRPRVFDPFASHQQPQPSTFEDFPSPYQHENGNPQPPPPPLSAPAASDDQFANPPPSYDYHQQQHENPDVPQHFLQAHEVAAVPTVSAMQTQEEIFSSKKEEFENVDAKESHDDDAHATFSPPRLVAVESSSAPSISSPPQSTIEELMSYVPNLAQYMPPGWRPYSSSSSSTS